MTLLYSDPIFLTHETGPHPESPARLSAILKNLETSGLRARCSPGAFSPLSQDDLLCVHDSEQINTVKAIAERGGGFIDADTILSANSFAAACAAAGAAVAATEAVLSGKDQSALCLLRPPGHHATESRSMGFCLFNNVALAAKWAVTRGGLARALIVDWDVHHGNGTQDIFYADPSVFYFSIHRYPFYPGTGSAAETGRGAGLGTTLNVPISYGTPRETYRDAFVRALERAAESIRPEIVFISAGFDAHREDPIGSLGLETEDFAFLTRAVGDVANLYAQGRIVSALEGGYNTRALADSVATHVETLLNRPRK